MKTEKDFIQYIKPIPKYIAKEITKIDKNRPDKTNIRRYYSYLTIINKDICKIIVAVKNINKELVMKQVAAHYVQSKVCYAKDVYYYTIAGYIVDFYNDSKWIDYDEKYFNMYSKVINIDVINKLDKYKYCAYNKLTCYSDIIKYLKIYNQYPQTEILLKLNLEKYVYNVSILKKMQKDKSFIKWLIKNKKEIDYSIDASVLLKAYKQNIDIKQAQRIANIEKDFKHWKDNKYINDMWKNKLEDFKKYILNQKTSIYSYMDYIEACRKIGLDMTIDKNFKPKEFNKWHEIRTTEYRAIIAKENADKKAALYNKFKIIAEKYKSLCYNKNDDFIIVIPNTPLDLEKEGNDLHHCVGRMGYDVKMSEEKSLILFLRKKEDPFTPFVTIEFSINKKQILQCYGAYNQTPEENILSFVNTKWLNYARNEINKLNG